MTQVNLITEEQMHLYNYLERKHNVYKQMRCSIIRKENAWEAIGGVERVALVKSLIYSR